MKQYLVELKLTLMLLVFIGINSCKDEYDYYWSGKEKIEVNDYKGAIADFSKAIEQNSTFIDAYRCRGKVKSFRGNYNEAILDYNEAIKINPKNKYTYEEYYDRGLAKIELNDYHGALNDFTKDLEFQKNSWILYAKRGLSKYYLKDYYGALQDCNKAVNIHNYMGYSYFVRGITKIKINDMKGACSELNRADELNTMEGQKCRDSIEKYCK